jgi:hypothetical protein
LMRVIGALGDQDPSGGVLDRTDHDMDQPAIRSGIRR